MTVTDNSGGLAPAGPRDNVGLLMMLERPITTRTAGMTWHGYSPYNPTIVQKLLDIFRVHYNYCKTEEKARVGSGGMRLPKRTPAMKLGLAKGVVRIEDILYFGAGGANSE